ncbi:DNA helicase [Domibacillus antri]|uniref:DNA helicase n=1 Tax=Domibacillus antri TaxID=1714264 RepID=A0A1Q8Q1X8_9BACI|nr:DEAD/DEAH box helicase [Domibacillus antri]OLN21315.1 DNA helicase [Domibacillus antri]
MGITKVTTVLKAWHLIESLVPSEVPHKDETIEGNYFEDNEKRVRTRLVDFDESPWKNQLKDRNNYKVHYHYYLACFEQYKLVSRMRDIFKNKEEIFNHDKTTLFSFSFTVDSEGNYVEDSMFVPFLMYVMKVMSENQNMQYRDLMNRFQSQLQMFEEQARTTFINGVTEKSLHKIQQVYQRYFEQIDTDSLNYLETEVKKNDKEFTSKNFNSFYLNDLQQIISKGENETIRCFIEGVDIDARIDLNHTPEYIEEILQPKYMPDGRWPSPVEHRLSLMQQVAVNQILNNDQKISSVNGPPGTGKTTLLKDVFADLVVQRAKEILEFKDPTDAFQKEGTLKLDGHHYPIFLINSNLSKFSMVVASSNNGAVENISKEFPQEDQIIRSDEKSKFKNYEELYAKEAKELSMYPSVAGDLLGNDTNAWGLFSGALGKSDNISSFGWKLQGAKDNEYSFLAQLEKDSKQVKLEDWQKAVKEFQEVYKSIQLKKSQLQQFAEQFKVAQVSNSQLEGLKEQIRKLKEKRSNTENEIEHLEQQKQLTEQQIQTLPKPSFFQKLIGNKNKQKTMLQEELNTILLNLKEKGSKLYQEKNQIEEKNRNIQVLRKNLTGYTKQRDYYEKQGLVLPEEGYWSDSQEAYEHRQLKTIWLTDELNFERGVLFLKAMKLHKLLLIFNFRAIKSTIRLLNNRKSLNLNDSKHRLYLKNMWQIIHLITPVVSTTFASFNAMYRGIEKDFIDYLFIDEAGQASPQQAAGALWRSKKAIVVGDPIQIEPVVTIDQTILEDVRAYLNLDNRYIDPGTSVQTLADQANPYGMLATNGQWIGTPLWVHRRCLNPMFTIANKIAYDNKMVLAKKSSGKSTWFDCKGIATNRQFVKEQGELVAEHIVELWEKAEGPPNVYIISPFTSVKEGVKEVIRSRFKEMQVSKKEINNWLKKSVGTVHTFQGKEADVVYLVTGTDENSDGAANWSCSKPNLLNVAVTRAKEEFYVIGDYKRFSTKQYYSSIIEDIDEVKLDSRTKKEG